MTEPVEDEFTELYDADVPRVDLVGKAANGTAFLIAKQDTGAGLLDPGFVRDLIAKQQQEPTQEDSVTVTGSPAAIAAMIANAPVRKADLTDADEPLPDADQVADDAGIPAADGDPDDPASPAWEQVDAERAAQAIELALALKRLVEQAQAREVQEASVGADGDDADNVFDLGDVLCAVDCILGVLAPFAVCEQAEAAERQADRDALLKGQIRKAGRVLSGVNEGRIKAAHDALTEVLASLPAPATDDGQPAAVEKEEHMDAPTAPETATAGAPVEAEVEKAKGDPQVAVYTADGKLVGVVDQADISPIAAPAAPEGGDEQSADGGGSDDDGSDAADTAPAADAAPAPDADAAQIPGTDTVAAPAPTPDDDTVAKATAAAAGALGEVLTPVLEQLAKQAGLEDVVKGLQERVEHLAKQPDDRKSPLLGAGTGTAGPAARDGGAAGDQFADLRKAVEDAASPAAKREAEQRLAFAQVRARFAG